MKLATFMLILGTLQLSATVVFSQDNTLNLKVERTSIAEVLTEIENQSAYKFAFSSQFVDMKREVTLEMENVTMSQALEALFADTNVDFRIENQFVILVPKVEEAKSVERFANLQQQGKTITGKVVDEQGEPIPGASIVLKGTTTGTISDMDGNFTLSGVPEDATLQFSFVGMATQEITLTGQSQINITMSEESIGLKEVVAIGYGTRRKNEVTGSVAVADLETYSKVPVANVIETVKGTLPGLNVGGTNQAGQVAGFSIRGQNSIGAGNTPLVVVDGVIYNGSVGDIAPKDIESFTVLKDASAAAIYGSRSANGVILIETKKGLGIEGKPVFDVNVNLGFVNQLAPNEMYNGEEYIQHVLDIRQSFGRTTDLEPYQYLQAIEQENYLATPDHKPTTPDPWSYFLQNAYSHSASLSFSNSTDKSSYYISIGARDQKGVVLNDNFRQITTRVNVKSILADWLNVTLNSSYTGNDNSGSEPILYRAQYLSPYASVFDENGDYTQFPQTTTSAPSPFWDMATDHSSISHNLLGTIKSELTFAKGLVLTSTFSNNLRWNNGANFYGSERTHVGLAANGQGSRGNSTNYFMLFDNYLTYKKVFATKHSISTTVLYSTESTTWNSQSLTGRGFENEVLGHYKLSDAQTQLIATGGGESSAIGQMARASYSYDNKYTLTGTVRRDGFSGFSANKKWGVFSSIGASWDIKKESFLANSNSISNLLFSASYGSVGNQAIGPYSTLAKVGTGKYIYAGSNDYAVTQAITSFATNNLGWETTTGLNLGLEFGVIQNRISGRLDAYKTTTRDLIFNVAIPAMAGGPSSIRDNVGEIDNEGIELALNSINISKRDFKWTSNFNFSLNRNKVITIFGDDNDGDGVEDDLISSNIFIGKSLGSIYTYKVIGMWQQEDVDNGTIMQGMRPGDYKGEDLPYETKDENGNIIIEDPDGRITSDKDRQFIGNTNPNFRWSLTNSVSYKNWTLMAYLYSIWGGNGWYQTTNAPYRAFGARETSVNTNVYDYWTPENTGALFPRPDYMVNAAYKIDKYFDRSFIKLQKIALTYDFSDMVKPIGINGLTATVSADNLATYAPHWIGLDPETGQGLGENSRPSLRTILFSVALNF